MATTITRTCEVTKATLKVAMVDKEGNDIIKRFPVSIVTDGMTANQKAKAFTEEASKYGDLISIIDPVTKSELMEWDLQTILPYARIVEGGRKVYPSMVKRAEERAQRDAQKAQK